MGIKANIEALVKTAESQVGYKEPYGDNHNKYAKQIDADFAGWYNGKKDVGGDWCTIFVDWCFLTTFGQDNAYKMLNRGSQYGKRAAVVQYMYRCLMEVGRVGKEPHVGDICFYHNDKYEGLAQLSHVGIVKNVDGDYIDVVEGNAGRDSDTVIVRHIKKTYDTKKWGIYGFGYPDYACCSKYPDCPYEIEVLKSGITGMRDIGYSDGKYLGTIDAGLYTVSKMNNDFGLIENHGWIYMVDQNVVVNPTPRTLDGYTVGQEYEVICSEPLNVRTKAEVSESAVIVTELKKGTRLLCKALTRDTDGNTWMRIDAPSAGWICCIWHGSQYVGAVKPESLDGYTEGKVYTVVAKAGLKVRLSPSTMATVRKILPYGTRVTCIGLKSIDGNTWMTIADGWIAAHYHGDRYVN